MTIDYKSAGVDIVAGNESVRRIKAAVESTFSPAVLTEIGHFGAMYDLKSLMTTYQHPVLVQSMDGVGTKMMVAKMMHKFDTIGIDLVSATVNDIIVLGAKPLTLLDYIANDKIDPSVIEQIVSGMVGACREQGIALVGGEMAEMPGTYCAGEYDLVGVVTGVVDKEAVILGDKIAVGDSIVAFASSGLHTNGYSLARKLLFEVGGYTVDTHLPELQRTVGDALLAPHINYARPVLRLLQDKIPIAGMAHITGGGLLENVARVLPLHCDAEIMLGTWPILPIFSVLAKLSRLENDALYRTFNMGVGYVMVLPKEAVGAMQVALKNFPEFSVYNIGQVVQGTKKVRLVG
ncbi:MAG: phosphoribosylformylglycinamidine cyclo-ligase [Gammaproteobacteria bacterium RIFCSPHIGHO2_12_FULL_42_10]|nr:MAG: phosphoribosylformylglycinamidine cyclo-ligase [Gammaproteobacteria bacterium RIFCSPHIGHO2_12_FULL_42_10]